MGHYEIVLEKLEKFIRRYYLNLIVRGSIILFACCLLFLFILFIAEINLYLSSMVKIFILSIVGIIALLAAFVWVIKPLLGLYNIRRSLDGVTASRLIGQHFPNVQDKLLNVLQLKQQVVDNAEIELIQASIDQKAAQIALVPFAKAINVKQNKKYLPYLIIPSILLIITWLILPTAFTNAGKRLLQPTVDFIKPAPFNFILKNKELLVPMYGNIELILSLEGDKLPSQVYCVIEDEKIEMKATDITNFQLALNKISKPTSFYFEGAGYQSKTYKIEVQEQPIIEGVTVEINYPAYIGKPNESHQSLSNWTLPEGTIVNWKIQTKHTEKVVFTLNDSLQNNLQAEGPYWMHQNRFLNTSKYSIDFFNKQGKSTQHLNYSIEIIKDQAPNLQIQSIADKTIGNQLLFVGTAADDYGLTKVLFVYIIEQGKNILKRTVVNIPLGAKLVTNIEHYFDAGAIAIQPGQTLKYYFEAWDNDGVNGSKVTRSDVYSYALPVDKALEEAFDKNTKAISSGLQQSETQQKQIQNDMNNLQKDLLQSKQMTWQQQQQIEQLAKQQEQLLQKMEAVKKRFEEQQKQAERKNLSPELQTKQEQLKKQLDQVVDSEMKKQLDKLHELLKQRNPEQAVQQLESIQQENKLSAMNMERIQELIEKLEMEMDLEKLSKNLEDLARKETDLQNKTADPQSDHQALKNEQLAIQKELDALMKNDFKELTEKSKQAQQQAQEGLEETKELAKEADEAMQESSESLKENNKSNAAKSQQKATNSLQKMAQKMQQMAGGMDMEQLDIDIKATRQLLSNLIRYSFDQEQLIKNVQQTTVSSPNFITLNKEQGRLRQNAKMIKDSLFVLSKRVFQIAATVNKETSELEYNLQFATTAMEQRAPQEILIRQQRAMTNANNLALILNELLENLMDAQSAGMKDGSDGKEGEEGQAGSQGQSGKQGKMGQKGDGSSGEKGNKSGQGGQKMKDIITKQQQLGSSMQQKANGNKGNQAGGSQGQGQQGGEGSDGNYGDAKELAKLAREQAQLRKQMQELNSYLNSAGVNGVSKDVKAIQELMDKNETDIVNKKLTSEFIARQQEIMQRMLQAENAIREQEEDNKRTGKTAEEKPRPIPPELKEYLEKNKELLEQYKTIAPTLQPYYKKISEQYLQKVN